MKYQKFLTGYETTEDYGAKIWANGKFKESQNNITIACLRPGDVCIDIGANIGYYTLLMSRAVGPQGQVFAIEPVPETYDWLNCNVKETKSTNVKTFQLAISDSIGEANLLYKYASDLDACLQGEGIYMSDSELGKNMEPKCKVATTTLNKFVTDNNITKLDFLKIDCQGADLLILKSALASINKFRPKIICEAIWQEAISKTEEFFDEIGYYHTCIEKCIVGTRLQAPTEHILAVPFIPDWP